MSTRLIYEPNLSVMNTFDSKDEALDFVWSLMTVNADDLLDELTVSSDCGHKLSGDALRKALEDRAREAPLPPGAIEIPWSDTENPTHT